MNTININAYFINRKSSMFSIDIKWNKELSTVSTVIYDYYSLYI